jgi:hypothetical protein
VQFVAGGFYDHTVFDAAKTIPIRRKPSLGGGIPKWAGWARRDAKDREPVRRLVTAKLMGDPPAWRAGRAPDCEDAKERGRTDLYADLNHEALKPRRYRPHEGREVEA